MGDGTLVFDTKIDRTGFDEGVREIESNAQAAEEALNGVGEAAQGAAEAVSDAMDAAAEATGSISDAASEAADALDDTRESGDDLEDALDEVEKEGKQSADALDELADSADDADKSMDGASKSAKDLGNRVGDYIKGKLGADLIEKAAGAVLDFGKKAIGLASDLEEVQNVVDVTFGESAAAVESFAKASSTQFGLTELQVKQYSGTLGAMVKSMGLTEKKAADMALDMVGLTGDVASFYNLDHDTAFEKIRSGLSGETEPLKQLGINMSQANLEAFALDQGIKTAYKDMSEAERVTLRYNYIMNATADAHGDFARTSDGYANQVRVLQNNIDSLAANLGKALLPAVNAGVGALNSLFEPREDPELNVTITGIQEAIDALTGEENGFEAQVDRIKMKYAEDVIEIRVNYQNAQTELENYEALLAQYEADGTFSDRETNIKIGMTGEDVSTLQQKLQGLGYTIAYDELVSGTFGETTLQAVKDFQEANGLAVDGIAGVEVKTALTQQTAGELQASVQALVDLYPELEQYVGEDGLFTKEAAEVAALIEQYNELAKSKAYLAMISDEQAAYYGAEANFEVLRTRRDIAIDEMKGAQKRAVEAQALIGAAKELDFGSGLRRVTGIDWFGNSSYENLDNSAIEERLRLLKQMYEFDPSQVTEAINGLGAAYEEIDWSFLIGGDGLFEDFVAQMNANGGITDEIANTVSGLMYKLVPQLDGTGSAAAMLHSGSFYETAGEAAGEVNQYVEAINDANTALDEAATVLNETQIELETAKETYNRVYGDTLGELPTKVGDVIISDATEAQAAVDGVLDAFAADVEGRVAAILASIQTAKTGAASGLQRSGTGGLAHATGLEYVPYDNYAARLHVGEAVLTADEAERWRAGQGNGFDYAALADAVRAGQSASRGAQPIVMQIDGKTIATALAKDNRSAIGTYNRRLAKGMGK